MAAALATSKKRKRVDNDDQIVTFKQSSQPGSDLGPVLVSFPGVQPPRSTPFQCYRLRKREGDEQEADFATQTTIVAGETDVVEYFPTIESKAVGCRYLVAVHNKRTNITTFRPAPVHILTRQVKRLKNAESVPVTVAQHSEARTTLGTTFGTKKAKAAIKARERNQVDVDAMQGVAGHLQSTIEDSTVNLPTQEEARIAADENRLIPPFDANAERPDDIYPIQSIIPDAEWNSISLSALMSAEHDRDRRALLPYNRSNWINQHLHRTFSAKKPNKDTVKLLMSIAAMLAFHRVRGLVNEKEKLRERLSRIPSTLLDGLLSRFTETARGSTQAHSTPQKETCLLTHMFALCLRVDEFATDTTLIAADLNMAITRVNQLFRSLGCKIETLKPTDIQRLRLPETAAQTKRAILRAPVKFPDPRARRRR